MAAAKVANSSVAIAMAFAGRSARACDVCANKSAHWFCAADDAYLCTACDTQVHSANALSLRHERVRLSPSGTPMKPSSKDCKVPKSEQPHGCTHKKLHPSPPQVAPVRKRSRTTRPYSHHLKKLTQVVKSELSDHSPSVKAELELFDFLDADEFLVADAGNQEVPNLATVIDQDSGSSPSSSDFDLLSSDYEFQDGDHTASADSFAAFFKGKAAHSQKVGDDGDQFLVPDASFEEFCNLDGETSSDTVGAPVVPADDAFFFPGDIPGLDVGFESFVPEMDLSSDDFSLSFDLALQNANNGVETFEGEHGALCKPKVEAQPNEFAAGPFAKWFATKTKSELDEPMCPEKIKLEAKAMLKCCLEDDDTPKVPLLQLNMQDILTAWSDRAEPWVNYKVPQKLTSEDSISSGASDVGLVPDMDANAAGDESQSSGDRDARVLRYKEKRRTRLFSKKIRYEVRKLNAERRPRMKGRFVKRTAATS
ncbi:hypothetical protein M758_8G172100 [Ceratodon purpureus]|uniref:Uncharacterized protein n=1 Tax=Ceratodon purpureus TaxID=3225 RepID=A0A8T0H854_CERPU|nr:hypothetical protein KC19_8G177400 [Ceratodon purpureus]KAG0609274.1 hypothetical protein M758_8G172100 [Ceratodon purpureus]